jgi:hypothetical protein
MLSVRRGDMGDTVMTEGESKAGVDDVAKADLGFSGPVPEGLGDIGFVVAKLPGGIGAESVAEGGGFGRSWAS